MESPAVDTLVRLAEQLSEDEQEELIHRLEALRSPRENPLKTLRVFHVDHVAENMPLRREDEYGDDGR